MNLKLNDIRFMKKLIALSLFMLMGVLGFSQNSKQAKQLLDQVSTKVKSYKNISINFKYSLNNKEENIEHNTKGNVVLKGDLYLLNLLGVTRMFDGKKIYTISSEDEEVTITNVADEDKNELTPSKMLTFYQSGYTYKLDKKLPVSGRSIQYVKLIPIDSNSEIAYVLLGIDANTKNIYNVIQNGKNGTTTTLTVNTFKTNQPLSESLFIFDRNKYKDYYFNE